jgi:glutaredoxin 3
MTLRRRIEVFGSGCAMCNETVELVRRTADPSCEVIVRSMTDSRVLARARSWAFDAFQRS